MSLGIRDQCRFGDNDPVVGQFSLPRGCLAFPDDREQALCLYHAMKSQGGWGIRLVRVVPDLPAFERTILAQRFSFVNVRS